VLPCLVNYRLQPRRSAHPQPPGFLPPYILTSLLPYLVFDRHVTKIPSPQPLCFPHLHDRDARNSFRFCSYANCRVSPAFLFHQVPFWSSTTSGLRPISFAFILLRTLLHFFAPPEISTPFFSSDSVLFVKKQAFVRFDSLPLPQLNPGSQVTVQEDSRRRCRHFVRRATDHRPRITPLVAPLPSGCYDLVFHDPC
jgi:hypothetical protein